MKTLKSMHFSLTFLSTLSLTLLSTLSSTFLDLVFNLLIDLTVSHIAIEDIIDLILCSPGPNSMHQYMQLYGCVHNNFLKHYEYWELHKDECKSGWMVLVIEVIVEACGGNNAGKHGRLNACLVPINPLLSSQ